MSVREVFYEKTCTCHHCARQFLTRKTRQGAARFIKRDSDFCTYYQNEMHNPILYTVNVCPDCGYAFTDQFQPDLPPHVQKRIQEHIASKWTAKDFGTVRSYPEAIAAYKLAIYAAMLTDQRHSVKAGLFMRLAWIYRLLKNQEEERRFLKLAADEYQQSYLHSDYQTGDKDMSEIRLLYLIGELMRRLEKHDQAIRYFAKVMEQKNRTIETGIVRMAHEQWSLTRQEYLEKQANAKLPHT